MVVFDKILSFIVNFWNNYGISLLLSIFFIISGYFAIKILTTITIKALKKANIKDRFIINMVIKSLKIGGWIAVALLILKSFHVSISSIMLSLSPLFLTFGLGCKNFITNIIKGIQLKILNPYKVGDEIEVDGIKGKVEQIDFLYTYMHTKDGGFVTIANSLIADKRIANFSQKKIVQTAEPNLPLSK